MSIAGAFTRYFNPPAGLVLALIGIGLGAASKVVDCAPEEKYNPGFYHETGAFLNYWGGFSWFGEGVELGEGLVRVYGTVHQAAPERYFEPIPYDNGAYKAGYHEGVQSADAMRENAGALADAKLPEFRSIASIVGTATITIELLCAGYGEIFETAAEMASYEAPSPGVDPATAVCLKIDVASRSTGSLEGAGYGEVKLHERGIPGTGTVSFNGVPAPSPITLDSDSSGINFQGGDP